MALFPRAPQALGQEQLGPDGNEKLAVKVAADAWRHAGKGTAMTKRWQENAGLLALRAGIGGVLVAHGVQKLFGSLGGQGLEGTGTAFEQMGFAPGRQSALADGPAQVPRRLIGACPEGLSTLVRVGLSALVWRASRLRR